MRAQWGTGELRIALSDLAPPFPAVATEANLATARTALQTHGSIRHLVPWFKIRNCRDYNLHYAKWERSAPGQRHASEAMRLLQLVYEKVLVYHKVT